MQSIREIKNRIRSVGNTRQIAKAMEVVAATKMRRSQEIALATRPFAVHALELLSAIEIGNKALPELMKSRPVARRGVIVISSDKGLAGSFNGNLLRKAESFIATSSQETPTDIITVGKKAKDFFARKNANIIKEYAGAGDFGTLEETEAIALVILDKFTKNNWDEVWAVYTHFQSTLKQQVIVRQFLPLTRLSIKAMVKGIIPEQGRFAKAGDQTDQAATYERIFEPSPEAVLAQLLPQLLRIEVYHAILESNASEHSARMLAMKKASDNAAEIIDSLSLQYNKSRQASITQELIEIIGGSNI